MADPNLNKLLKWSIENSEATRNDVDAPTDPQAQREPNNGLTQEMLAQLMGGPSDADLMKESMAAIHSPDVSHKDKMIAWDNFEQLIEGLDNANNMESLGLWMPLVEKLDDKESEVRMMACWCISTAVQNNVKSQERLLAVGALPKIIDIAINDDTQSVRRKAVSALSSAIRNYQPALDAALKHLPQQFQPAGKVDAAEMEDVDSIIGPMRDHAAKQ